MDKLDPFELRLISLVAYYFSRFPKRKGGICKVNTV